MTRPSLSTTLLFSVLLTSPAMAVLDVCNHADSPSRIAIGWFDGRQWTSQGWWTVQPRSCKAILTGPLQSRFYYLYGSDGVGTWDGKIYFCTSPAKTFR